MTKNKLLLLLALLMTAATGAWAQRLYLEVDGTAATLKYSANEADYSGKPSFTGTTWQNASGFKASVKTITVDASCENFAGDKLQGLFSGCSELTSITGLGTINTTNVTTMQQMFFGCSALTSVDLSGLNTANVTTMQNMFYNCSSLETVDFSGFNTSSVTNMSNMFYNCSGLGTLDLSSFNTSSVTNMSYMFRGCAGLQTLDLSGFNTSSVTNMSYMFSSCTGLKSVNFSGLNTSGVTTMTYMFQGCTGLQTLDLSDLNTSSVTDMRNMFHNCTGLQTLDISSFNTENVTKMGSMFHSCSQLTAIFVGADWIVASSANSMFTDCTNLPNWDGTSDGTKAYYGGDGKGYLTYKVDGPPASTYTVSFAENTEDAANWTGKAGNGDYQALPLTGVAKGAALTLKYAGTKLVKSVKAVVKMPEVEGALKGQFAIDGSGNSIVFAKGNLQATWDGTSWTWAFAEHQWDVIGGRWSDASVPQTGNNLINGNGTMSAAGTMDLFSWVGASSTLTGLAQYGITNSNNDDDFGTVAGETLKTDWGTLAISNGGNAANSGWRTLTKAEWKYLMEERSGTRYAKATVNGVAGVILLPDGWSAASLTKTNDQYADYTANTITADAWVNDYEANGAVFLPMGGFRATSGETGTVNVVNFNSPADYWSTNSDEFQTNHSNGMFCYSTDLTTAESDFRKFGKSVRLVREVK